MDRIANPSASTPRPVILYDGVCKLCHATVRFVTARDPHHRFAFVALQSAKGRELLAAHGHPPVLDPPDSVLLLDGKVLYTRSDAALRIMASLGLPWKIVSLLHVVPRPLRDAVYRLVARRRYQWFGRTDVCALPPEEHGANAQTPGHDLSGGEETRPRTSRGVSG